MEFETGDIVMENYEESYYLIQLTSFTSKGAYGIIIDDWHNDEHNREGKPYGIPRNDDVEINLNNVILIEKHG